VDTLEDSSRRLESKLDLLISLLRIAHREPIEAARDHVLSDKVNGAVLQVARRGWIEAGELKKVTASKTKTSKPTIERRIAELVELGALERAGAGGHVRYRATSLFDF
jgi:Fic family protein